MPRQTPEELGIEPFVGEAVTPKPTDPKSIPDHPILNNDGDSRIHNDHYNTGVYDRPGPTGPAIEVISHQLGSLTGICAMMAMLENGYVIASCFIGEGPDGIKVNLIMFDNENLDIVARREIGPRPFIPNSSGGAYFTMDAEENIIIGPPNNLQQYHIEVNDGAPEFVLDKSIDMTPYIRDNALLQDSVIDYDGRLWFMATTEDEAILAAERAVEATDATPGVITTFPGGVASSASKASKTNHPSTRGVLFTGPSTQRR